LIKSLQVLAYESSRQVGSHIRLTTQLDGEYHITVPNHAPPRLGTPSKAYSNLLLFTTL
jgi:predicted RNA binding protein YcfA (HicA-like mRNA interferase family)